MDYCDIVVYCGYGQMDSVWSLLLLLRTWMGYGYTIIRVVYWVELPEQKRLLDFFENMDPDKWDTTIWYRGTKNPQEFYGLTGCQRDSGVLGRPRALNQYLPNQLALGYQVLRHPLGFTYSTEGRL